MKVARALGTLALLCLSLPSLASAQQTEPLELCVIVDGALRQVEVLRDTETWDTLAAPGQHYRAVYPHVLSSYGAGNAWFAAGDPIGHRGVRYETYGLPRVLGVEEVVRIGTWAGVPLFGESESAEVVYVPARAGCEFQPYQRAAGSAPAEPDPAPEITTADRIRLRIVEKGDIAVRETPQGIVSLEEVRFSLAMTSIVLRFDVPANQNYAGTFHPPGSAYAFRLGDAGGNGYAALGIEGWYSAEDESVWGRMTVPPGEAWYVTLVFPPVPPEFRNWLNLTEGTCTERCWHFRGIRLTDR